MFKSIQIFAFFILSFRFAIAEAPVDPRVVELVEGLRTKAANAGMAVAIVSKDEVKHLSLHGTGDIQTNQALSLDSLFMIGSTTKAMTATLGAIAVSRAHLQWDSPVRDYLDQFALIDPIAAQNCSLRDLLLHRSGVPRHDYAWLAQPMSSEGYLELFAKLPPSAQFREKFQYQNLGYMTAGLMIGRSMNESWADLLKTEVFAPLEMSHTRAMAQELSSKDLVAQPHALGANGIEKIQPRNIDAVGPAGSVYSSIQDMAKWVQFNLEAIDGQSRLATSDLMNEIYRPQILVQSASTQQSEFGDMHYGLGWMISKYRGQRLITHGGGIDGYLTQIVILPESDVGIVILTNGGALYPSIVSYTIADHLLGAISEPSWLERSNQPRQGELPPEGISFPESMQSAAGVFSNSVYGKLYVSEREADGAKYLEIELGERTGLIYMVAPWIVSATQWLYKLNGLIVEVELVDGVAVSIAVNWEPSLPPIKFDRLAQQVAHQ